VVYSPYEYDESVGIKKKSFLFLLLRQNLIRSHSQSQWQNPNMAAAAAATAACCSSSPKTHISLLTPPHFLIYANIPGNPSLRKAPSLFSSSPRGSLVSFPLRAVAEVLEQATDTRRTHVTPPVGPRQHSKIDQSGRFCNPRAARELAMSVIILFLSCIF
jgi:hypothetical protein